MTSETFFDMVLFIAACYTLFQLGVKYLGNGGAAA